MRYIICEQIANPSIKMIRPEDHEKAISTVRFMAGVAHGDRQYTFVELFVKARTTRTIMMSFYVPKDSDARNESALVSAMGGSPINDALDAWDMKTDATEQPNHVVAALFEDLDETTASSKVSGCNRMALLTIPPGPCTVNACWSHKADPRAIFIPTQNENMSEWRMDAVVIGGFAETSGKAPLRPLTRAFRFDLAFTQNVVFGSLDNSILMSRWSPALPFHNLHVPRARPDPNNREYFGISGAHVVDNTRNRLVMCYDVSYMTLPVICGCYIRHSTSFAEAYVPLAVPERATRTHPIVFSDNNDGTNTILMSVAGVNCYIIDPAVRESCKGITWIPMRAM